MQKRNQRNNQTSSSNQISGNPENIKKERLVSGVPSKSPTSWGQVATWYDDYLSNPESYQSKVILPNLLRIVAAKKGERVLDLACGQGFFSAKLHEVGARVVGVDISSELIIKARARHRDIDFRVAPANKLPLEDATIDVIVCVLALQNIAELEQTFAECRRVLKPHGRFVFVLNHPAFRIPQASDWTYDQKTETQNRVISKYLSEIKTKINMHPGESKKVFTISFHRPLQVFVKFLAKNHFVISRLEEWISHKKSEHGPRALAEDKARKEIPMFMCIEASVI